jgi:hypothetical protein
MKHTYIVLILLFILSCKDKETAKKKEIEAFSTIPTLFTLLNQEESGFYFMNEVNQSETFNVLTYENFYNGGGVGIGDINNDGLPDIFMTGNTFGGRLYLNKGNLKFEQISESANVFTNGFTTDVSFVDINNDGFQDIYLSKTMVGEIKYRENVLLVNNKNNMFTNKAKEYGIADAGYSNQSVFFDYDNDGYLDLYVSSGSNEFENGEIYQDRVYINDGKGNFVRKKDVLPIITTSTSCVTPIDYDNDGDMDLFIGGFAKRNNYPLSEKSWLLQNDNGKFIDKTDLLPNNGDLGIVNDAIAFSNNELIIVGEWMNIIHLKKDKTNKFIKAKNNGLDKSGGW